jgi:hypothetical protein
VHVDERSIDDRTAERISGMATKAFGEVGRDLEPSAPSGEGCGGGVELDGADRGRLERRRSVEDEVCFGPTAEAHQAASGDAGVEGAEARLEPGPLGDGGAVLGDAQCVLGSSHLEEDHGEHGVGERPLVRCEAGVDRGAAVLEAPVEIALEHLDDTDHSQGG